MGVWITVGIFLFVIGSMMALKPSAKQKALGLLRERGRVQGLNPKLVACPEWLINANGEKGKGMVALYSLVVPEAKLPLSEALVIDHSIEVVKGDVTLADQPCPIDDALGLVMQANFIGIYIKEALVAKQNTADIFDARLKKIKENLQMWVEKVQA